jgi:hypothetical protein
MSTSSFTVEERAVERWRTVPRFAGRYDVSDLGRVRTRPSQFARGRLVRRAFGAAGQPVVELGESILVRVADLVAEVFLSRPAEGDLVLRYKDGDPRNCRASNLLWAIRLESALPVNRPLRRSQVRRIRTLKGKVPKAVPSARFGVSPRRIAEIWGERRTPFRYRA